MSLGGEGVGFLKPNEPDLFFGWSVFSKRDKLSDLVDANRGFWCGDVVVERCIGVPGNVKVFLDSLPGMVGLTDNDGGNHDSQSTIYIDGFLLL